MHTFVFSHSSYSPSLHHFLFFLLLLPFSSLPSSFPLLLLLLLLFPPFPSPSPLSFIYYSLYIFLLFVLATPCFPFSAFSLPDNISCLHFPLQYFFKLLSPSYSLSLLLPSISISSSSFCSHIYVFLPSYECNLIWIYLSGEFFGEFGYLLSSSSAATVSVAVVSVYSLS